MISILLPVYDLAVYARVIRLPYLCKRIVALAAGGRELWGHRPHAHSLQICWRLNSYNFLSYMAINKSGFAEAI